MRNDLVEVKSSIPVRKFVQVYHDTLRANLTCEEKLIYIILKSFVDFGCEEGDVYPSMDTICSMSGMSRPRATRVINKLVENGYVKKKRRGVTKPNLYTVADYPAMWKEETTLEERKKILDAEIPYTTDQLLDELVRRGVLTKDQLADKKNGSVSAATENDPNGKLDANIPTTYDSTHFYEYSQEYIHGIYSYDDLAQRLLNDKTSLDAVMEILYEALNSQKQTIRIKGDDKPSDVVKSKLLKLDSDDIWYAIIKYKGIKDRVKKPKEYMLAILYGAKEQRSLDDENSKSYYRALICEEQHQEGEKQDPEEVVSKNTFCNFPQNRYDFDLIEEEFVNMK